MLSKWVMYISMYGHSYLLICRWEMYRAQPLSAKLKKMVSADGSLKKMLSSVNKMARLQILTEYLVFIQRHRINNANQAIGGNYLEDLSETILTEMSQIDFN